MRYLWCPLTAISLYTAIARCVSPRSTWLSCNIQTYKWCQTSNSLKSPLYNNDRSSCRITAFLLQGILDKNSEFRSLANSILNTGVRPFAKWHTCTVTYVQTASDRWHLVANPTCFQLSMYIHNKYTQNKTPQFFMRFTIFAWAINFFYQIELLYTALNSPSLILPYGDLRLIGPVLNSPSLQFCYIHVILYK